MRILPVLAILSIPLVAMRAPTLSGTVVDETGCLVAGAAVTAMECVRYCADAGPVAGRTTTDALGRFELPWSGRKLMIVVRGERLVVEHEGPHVLRLRPVMAMPAKGSRVLRGSVRDEQGRAIGAARVRACQGDGVSHATSTDETGAFVFERLAQGHVRLVLWRDSYETACVDPVGDVHVTLRRRP